MHIKVSIIATCLLVAAAVVNAKPHVFAPVPAPAFVTAQSTQVFARTYNGIVPIAVTAAAVPAPAPVPVPIPVPAAAAAVPAAFPAAVPTPVFVPPTLGAPALFSYAYFGPTPAAAALPAVPVTPAVVATPAAAALVPAAAKVVAAAPAPAKVVAAPVPQRPYLTTIRYRTVVS